MGSKIKTDFLFSSPSFASGASRLLDWGGTFDCYNVSANGKEADTKAMLADWVVVGDDIADAINAWDEKNPLK
jgi:hypothetical protein